MLRPFSASDMKLMSLLKEDIIGLSSMAWVEMELGLLCRLTNWSTIELSRVVRVLRFSRMESRSRVEKRPLKNQGFFSRPFEGEGAWLPVSRP
jgi:hypothetical protein